MYLYGIEIMEVDSTSVEDVALIVPLPSRNTAKVNLGFEESSFNCTFMELK